MARAKSMSEEPQKKRHSGHESELLLGSIPIFCDAEEVQCVPLREWESCASEKTGPRAAFQQKPARVIEGRDQQRRQEHQGQNTELPRDRPSQNAPLVLVEPCLHIHMSMRWRNANYSLKPGSIIQQHVRHNHRTESLQVRNVASLSHSNEPSSQPRAGGLDVDV